LHHLDPRAGLQHLGLVVGPRAPDLAADLDAPPARVHPLEHERLRALERSRARADRVRHAEMCAGGRPEQRGRRGRALVERELFEFWAFIVPGSDLDVHRETMRRFPRGDAALPLLIREWMRQNNAFRRYVLRELRRRGPLRSRDLEDRAVVPWWTGGGWNDGKSLGRMLDYLWAAGTIA